MKDHTVKIGDKFDDLTVTGAPFSKGKNRRVPFKCVCGKKGDREIHALFREGTFIINCGCNRRKRDKLEVKNSHGREIFNSIAQKFYLGML